MRVLMATVEWSYSWGVATTIVLTPYTVFLLTLCSITHYPPEFGVIKDKKTQWWLHTCLKIVELIEIVSLLEVQYTINGLSVFGGICIDALLNYLIGSFYYLEHNNYLNPINEVHVMVLHYVFLPRINQALLNFKEAWNHHAIRTEGSYTPTQLFVSRALELRESGLVALDFFDVVDESYGLDEDGLSSAEASGVTVPINTFTLKEEHLFLLQQTVDPLSDSNNFGIDLFFRTLQFVRDMIRLHPQEYPV